jgi:nicotinamide mononucleotide transporter
MNKSRRPTGWRLLLFLRLPPRLASTFKALRMLAEFLAQLRSQTLLDWSVTGTALLYVGLAARNNPWCWVWGAISCSLWGYASFFLYQLYSDAVLQIFYVVMALVGIYQWQRGGAAGAALPIRRMPRGMHLVVIASALVSGWLLGTFFSSYGQAAATYYDALTTTFSVAATFLLVQRYRENWLYWIGIDLAYANLYYSQGALLFAVLMLIYTIIAYFGYRNWRPESAVL